MALEVIGAGFGRTGTLSLKVALEKLGFDACYHMLEVHRQPDHASLWSRASAGEQIDWEALLEGYSAAVDWPACSFWRSLADRYPEARVVLSLRDADRWYKSMHDTVYQAMRLPLPADAPTGLAEQMAMAREIVLEKTFDGRFEDRAHAIDVYERHNQEVQAAFGSDRLLVFEAAQGWEPLCRFLERPIPDEDFPRVNDTASFRDRMKGAAAPV